MNDFQENIADTAERTLSERQIETVREQGGLFVEAVRVTRMPMLVTDATLPGNPITFANQAFIDLSGYTIDELLGQGPHFMNTSSHFGFLGCGGVGWLGWGRLRRCSAGRARWRPSEGQGFQELGPGGEHNIGAQGLQVVEEAGSGSKRLAGVPPSA